MQAQQAGVQISSSHI